MFITTLLLIRTLEFSLAANYGELCVISYSPHGYMCADSKFPKCYSEWAIGQYPITHKFMYVYIAQHKPVTIDNPEILVLSSEHLSDYILWI